jgi:hypothetical protein
MKQTPSREAASRVDGQQLIHLLCNTKIQH